MMADYILWTNPVAVIVGPEEDVEIGLYATTVQDTRGVTCYPQARIPADKFATIRISGHKVTVEYSDPQCEPEVKDLAKEVEMYKNALRIVLASVDFRPDELEAARDSMRQYMEYGHPRLDSGAWADVVSKIEEWEQGGDG